MATLAGPHKCTIDLESTYGTGAGSPTAIPVFADGIPELKNGWSEAEYSVSRFRLPAVMNMQYWETTLRAYLKGANHATNATELTKLIQICGFSKTSGTNIFTYAPVNSSFPSGTIAINSNGVLYTITGARGGLSIKCKAGTPVEIEAKIRGLYNAMTTSSYSAPSFADVAVQPPMFASCGLTIGGATFVLPEINFELGGFPEVIEDGNAASSTGIGAMEITGGDWGGSFIVQRDTNNDIEFWTYMIASTEKAIASSNGFGGAGNGFKFTVGNIQIESVKEIKRNNLIYYDVKFRINYNATLASMFSLTELLVVA